MNEKWQLTKWFFYQKLYVLYGLIATFGASLVNFTACWPNANFYILVNHKITLWIDWKIFNLQLNEGIIDQNFPTFYIPIYSYKTYIFYCYETFLPGTCWKKLPIMYKVLRLHGFPVTKVHKVSHGPVKRWFFHLVNAMFGVRILQIFVHIYPYKTSMQITIYLGLWRIWFWTDSVNAAFASPNFCTYLSIQKVYAYYNILGTKKNFVLNRFGQCIFCSLDSLNFRTYISIQNIYANYNILFWWICLPYFRLTE